MKAEAPAFVALHDADALARLDHELRGAHAWSCRQFDALLEDRRYRLWGTHRHGVLIAFIVCSAGPFDLEIEMLGVDVRHRRCGIAGALVKTVIEWGRRSGYERLLLEVCQGNEAALGLYARLGFALDGRRPGYYPPASGADPGAREDALLMSCALARLETPDAGPSGALQ